VGLVGVLQASVFRYGINIYMIVTSIQRIVSSMRDSFQTRVYKAIQDPVTMKEYVTCEVYTQRGVVEKPPDKGHNVDKQA
jgi:hypothetical protein